MYYKTCNLPFTPIFKFFFKSFGEFYFIPIFATPYSGDGEVPEWPKGTVC